jgi:hypothetical protein
MDLGYTDAFWNPSQSFAGTLAAELRVLLIAKTRPFAVPADSLISSGVQARATTSESSPVLLHSPQNFFSASLCLPHGTSWLTS